uniref:Chromosome 10 open reading frame 53 n=1 Tax=Mandrillus leucophaeus TaxID=9568 RepID=A0A2K6ALD7_MANLE
MPKNAVVILRYGPYSAAGLPVEHHTFRLQGLQAVLARDGHEVILEKIEDWNVVELMVNEEVVFHCNIKDLEFGKPFGDISSQDFLSSPCGMKAFPLQYFPLLYCIILFYIGLDHMLISELEKRETQPY